MPSAKVSAKNWIGLYSNPGNGPVDQVYVGASTIWQYVDGTSGSATSSTAALSPGNYIAYYLYNDGYTWLAQPVTFTVKPVPPVPPQVYKSAFGNWLSSPSGIALDAQGHVLVSDTGRDRVEVFTAAGRWIGGFGDRGRLNGPTALATDKSGNVYVADSGNNRVQVSPRRAGTSGASAPACSTTRRASPWTPRATSTSGTPATTGWSSSPPPGPTSPASARWPGRTASGWTARATSGWPSRGNHDSGPDQVTEFSPAGNKIISLGASISSGFGGMSNPTDVALDGSGHVYAAVPDYSLVETFTAFGPYLNEFGTDGRGLLANAQALTVAPSGLVYVADTGNDRVVIFTPGKAS